MKFEINENYWNFLKFSDYQDIDGGLKMKQLAIDGASFSVKVLSFLGSVFLKEIKPVKMEKKEFVYRENQTITSRFWKVRTIRILFHGQKTSVFLTKSPFANVDLSIDTMMEEIGPVVWEKYAFEQLDKNIKNSTFWILLATKILMQGFKS